MIPPPLPPEAGSRAQLQFSAAPHPELAGVTMLMFSFGPMTTQVFWPTAELHKLVGTLQQLEAKAPRIQVPKILI